MIEQITERDCRIEAMQAYLNRGGVASDVPTMAGLRIDELEQALRDIQRERSHGPTANSEFIDQVIEKALGPDHPTQGAA